MSKLIWLIALSSLSITFKNQCGHTCVAGWVDWMQKRNGSISTTDTSDFYYLKTTLSAVLNNVNVSN